MTLIRSLFDGALPATVMFDLDGTLVDSAPDLATAMDATLADFDLPPAGEAQVRHWVGNGALKLVQRALAAALHQGVEEQVPQKILDEAFHVFLARYASCCVERSRLYPQVVQVLQTLEAAGVLLACVTNKPTRFTGPMLEVFGIASYFKLVLSGDSFSEKKPHPKPLQYVMRQWQLLPEQCLMVGDSCNDVQAAQAAGVKVLCLTYGYNHGEDVRSLGADAYADHFGQLMS